MRGAAAALLVCLVGLGGCGTSASGGAGAADATGDAVSPGEDAAQGETGSGPDQTAEAAAADAPGSPPDASGSSADAANDVATDARSDSTVSTEAGGSACVAATDCRKFSDYCGGCNCLALGAHDPDPTCDAGTVSCFADPCSGHAAACGPTGHCVLQ